MPCDTWKQRRAQLRTPHGRFCSGHYLGIGPPPARNRPGDSRAPNLPAIPQSDADVRDRIGSRRPRQGDATLIVRSRPHHRPVSTAGRTRERSFIPRRRACTCPAHPAGWTTTVRGRSWTYPTGVDGSIPETAMNSALEDEAPGRSPHGTPGMGMFQERPELRSRRMR